MFSYVLLIAVVVYFFVVWPRHDDLPPVSKRTTRQRLAGKFGLHDEPSIGELHLTDKEKDKLVDYLEHTDVFTYSLIAKSTHFYLVEERQSILSVYCSLIEPIGPIDYRIVKTRDFLRLNIDEDKLVHFLKELQDNRQVRVDESS